MTDRKKYIEREAGPLGLYIKEQTVQLVTDMQVMTRLDSFTVIALIGGALGSCLACTDDGIEKDAGWEEGNPAAEPLKQTLLANFDVAYNEHRSKHKMRECKEKPEPKIV